MTSAEIPAFSISKRAAHRIRQGHSWVYRSDLLREVGLPSAAVVHVVDEKGQPLGSALSSSSSQIALRMISQTQLRGDDELNSLLRRRIAEALEYRKLVVQAEATNAYRIIFSEADGLPGVIADRYNDVITLQLLTQAMNRADLRQSVIDALLAGVEAPKGAAVTLVERADARIRELENLSPSESRMIAGNKATTIFSLNGLKFHFDALVGQKTGAFLDQRENYAVAEMYAHGDALDVFCYEGGFALHLGRRCKSVTGVDSSRAALEAAEKNFRLNKKQFVTGEMEWLEANAFDLLRDYASSGRLYDTIVLDPPAFAKSKRTLGTAMRGYKELNLRAMKMLRPGGILVTCSCSFHVSETEFLDMLVATATDARRKVKVLEKRGQAKDHPVVLGMPETAYLKCIICRVESM